MKKKNKFQHMLEDSSCKKLDRVCLLKKRVLIYGLIDKLCEKCNS